MARFVIRRLASSVLVLFLASAVIFLLISIVPGDVAKLVAERQAGAAATPEYIEKVERRLNLDEPLPERYVDWLAGIPEGDLGESLRTGQPIADELADRIPDTALLIAGAAVFAVLLGVGVGILGALRPYGFIDRLTRAGALVSVSVAHFFLGALLILVFGMWLDWLPTFGNHGPSSWILPWITLGLFAAGIYARLTRVALEEAMSRPYATTAKSKGASRGEVIVRDAMPNVALPLIAAIGVHIGGLIIVAGVVETVFSWQGVSLYFLDSVRFRDYPAMQATLLLFATFFITVTTMVDIASFAIDPRQRRATRAAMA